MNAFLVDIGGTWTRFRSGSNVERVATPSKLRHPQKSSDVLARELVLLLAGRVPTDTDAHVSLGAAYDPETDIAYGSGPLWGTGRHDIPFRRLLERQRPDVRWTVTNDVTAGLAHFTKMYARPADRQVMYVTISSGIALRTAHLPSRRIHVNAEGLQGEVGHLPATSTAIEAVRGLTCECGGVGHIAAIAAGPAIPHVAEKLGIDSYNQPRASEDGAPTEMDERLLRVIIEPIANLIRTACVLQPHIDLIGIGGGVPSGIGTRYKHELYRQLSAAQSYVDSQSNEGPRLHLVSSDQVCPETGAALMAQGYLENVK
ncbi:ROK family protein [Corynebacterium genitalium ATCC 33030]|uniref:ROK family protein n=1 Tax=Corynebacterium genitalium ATCC 33030 TaxID=585529 RepID=D7WBX7_9CORY|nr:ROK family protein [Corynebacterium genitalium]EFK54606.1 hypothetical protein HMPREF0291_10986 [Corynebacterium genitalium ATCC 33030]UUA89064.1 ROK family protein [Corynebacterium genitalium ATCC 33030]